LEAVEQPRTYCQYLVTVLVPRILVFSVKVKVNNNNEESNIKRKYTCVWYLKSPPCNVENKQLLRSNSFRTTLNKGLKKAQTIKKSTLNKRFRELKGDLFKLHITTFARKCNVVNTLYPQMSFHAFETV